MFTPEFLKRYRVDGRLAEGGMGVLWKGVHLGLDQPVAIKVLRAGAGEDAALRSRFLSEARLTAKLCHEHIVRVLDQGQDGEKLYITYEFIEGVDLRVRLQQEGRLEPGTFFEIGLGIARAVEHAHAAGIIHRDLKPENVLLGRDGRVLVGDFGLARQLEASGQRTATGVMLGTLSYMSPEVALGERATPASDVYALGLIAFEMLAGRRPFEADGAVAMLRLHADAPPPPLASFRPDVPPALDRLVAEALRKSPGERPTAAQWRSRLERASAQKVWRAPGGARQQTLVSLPGAAGSDRAPAPGQGLQRPSSGTNARSAARHPPEATVALGRDGRPADQPRTGTDRGAPSSRPLAPRLGLALTALGVVLALVVAQPWRRQTPAEQVAPVAAARQPDSRPSDGSGAPRALNSPVPPRPVPARSLARETLSELTAALTGPGSPDHDRLRLVTRNYVFTLGEPSAPRAPGIDPGTQRKEVDRLAGELRDAVSWEPPGGLAPLLEQAARRLESDDENLAAKLRLLDALQPMLDLEACVLLHQLGSRSPYHDFLYGVGKTARRGFVLAPRDERDLDRVATLVESSAGSSGSATAGWSDLESGPLPAASVESGKESCSVWFLKMAGSVSPFRLRASECRTAATSPAVADPDAFVVGPYWATVAMKWRAGKGVQAELWARTAAMRRTFRLQVKVAGLLDVAFRLHPRMWQGPAPAALAFVLPAPELEVSRGVVPMVVELHLLPGEDVFTADLAETEISMQPAALVLRLIRP